MRVKYLVFAAILAIVTPSLEAQHYSATDLGTLGGDFSYATSVNGSGEVVGYSKLAKGRTHAFIWTDARFRNTGRNKQLCHWDQ